MTLYSSRLPFKKKNWESDRSYTLISPPQNNPTNPVLADTRLARARGCKYSVLLRDFTSGTSNDYSFVTTDWELISDIGQIDQARRVITRLARLEEALEKPWRAARPGEVWALGIGGGYHCDGAVVVQENGSLRFIWAIKGGVVRNIAIDDLSIDYGNRIYKFGGMA